MHAPAQTPTTLDIDALRADTPGCAHVVHFNHAGSSLMPRPVIDAVIDHTLREATIGGYEAADQTEDRREGVYRSIATMIGAEPTEIALIENATRAWDMAFYAIDFRPGDRILTSMAEYHSNVVAFLQVAQRGVSVEVVPNDEHGQINVAALKAMLDDRVRLVSVSHMPTNGGLVQPAVAVGAAVRGSNALYLLDACQTVGQLPIDVRVIGCHLLSATSRKYLRGPRGSGFLYCDQAVLAGLTPPMLDGHAAEWTSRDAYTIRDDARRFENWEHPIANELGLGAAVDYALALGMDAIWDVVQRQAATLREQLSHIPGVTTHDLGEVKGGIVTFSIAGVSPRQAMTELGSQKINIRSSGVSSTRYDMEQRGLDRILRASIHYLTTDEEIDLLTAAVEHLAATAG